MRKMLEVSLAAILGITLCGISGCSKSGGGVDTAKLQSAFQSAPPVDKAEVDNAISAVKSGNYAGALASAQKVATKTNLTPEQKSAVQDFISQVQSKGLGLGEKAVGGAGDAANQAGQGAGKASEDLQKSLKK
jgi:hypothetical protein